MSDGIEKRLAGRPFKMQEWVSELVNILSEEDILFLSDKDLVFLVNRRLPEENQISLTLT